MNDYKKFVDFLKSTLEEQEKYNNSFKNKEAITKGAGSQIMSKIFARNTTIDGFLEKTGFDIYSAYQLISGKQAPENYFPTGHSFYEFRYDDVKHSMEKIIKSYELSQKLSVVLNAKSDIDNDTDIEETNIKRLKI